MSVDHFFCLVCLYGSPQSDTICPPVWSDVGQSDLCRLLHFNPGGTRGEGWGDHKTLNNPASKTTSCPTEDDPTEQQTDRVDCPLLLVLPQPSALPPLLSLSLPSNLIGVDQTQSAPPYGQIQALRLSSFLPPLIFTVCKIGWASFPFPFCLVFILVPVSLCAGHQGIL